MAVQDVQGETCHLVREFPQTMRGSQGSCLQREHSASIKTAPAPYAHASPPSRQKVIEIDCRGLEFTDFKSDVSVAKKFLYRRV